MAHKPGDLVEVNAEDGGTVPGIVCGNADENGGAVGVFLLTPNHYASDGKEVGQIKPKAAAKPASKPAAKK